jgi:WD40 repeat protein
MKEQNGFSLSSFELSQSSSFIATSADNQIIISGNQDKKDIQVRRQDGSYLFNNRGKFYSAAVSADGRIIFLGSENQEVRVLRQDGNGSSWFNLFASQGKVNRLAISANGQILVSSGSDRTVKVWHFDLDYLLVKGCEQLQEYLNSHPEVDRSQLCPK